MKLFKLSLLVFFLIQLSCTETNNSAYKEKINNPELFQEAMQNLTDIVVYDIFSPPVASRVYLYPTIAAYEIIASQNPEKYNSLEGQVKELSKIPKTENPDVNAQLAAIYAFNSVGKALIFSENKMLLFQEKLEAKLKEFNVPKKVIQASKKYANQVATFILVWASQDTYSQTRTFPKYTIKEDDRFWKPTPPDYMDGIEPHWKEIRTMVLDSSNQFPPKDPLAFNLKKGSPFQKQLMEVFEVTNSLTEEQVNIAKFWDCNPYVSINKGHFMFAAKKITPGAHWIGICKIASKKQKLNFENTVFAYTKTAVAINDAFISCWDEKYRSNLIRPETLIHKYLDVAWTPALQTPPFPEYTSGHSVISTAAAEVLTAIFGDKFKFEDTTEEAFGLGSREYNSFKSAAAEAAISRLYGGIHYRSAVEEGEKQGKLVGAHVNNQLVFKR